MRTRTDPTSLKLLGAVLVLATACADAGSGTSGISGGGSAGAPSGAGSGGLGGILEDT